jgi:hypothetical protein
MKRLLALALVTALGITGIAFGRAVEHNYTGKTKTGGDVNIKYKHRRVTTINIFDVFAKCPDGTKINYLVSDNGKHPKIRHNKFKMVQKLVSDPDTTFVVTGKFKGKHRGRLAGKVSVTTNFGDTNQKCKSGKIKYHAKHTSDF